MAKNTINQGDIITIKDIKSGHSQKGDWCFIKAENCDKMTLWVDNHDFKANVGDTAEILEIKSCSIKVNKVNDNYYNNYNVSVILKKQGDVAPFADNDIDFGADEDFI